MSDFKVVRIDWVDVQSLDLGLVFPHDLTDEPVACSLVGFLVKETKQNYFVAKEVWDNGACKYVHIIPKKFVEEIYELEPKELKK